LYSSPKSPTVDSEVLIDSNQHTGDLGNHTPRQKITIRKSASLKDLFFGKNNNHTEKRSTNNPQTRRKFTDIVQKHLLPLNFVTSFKTRRKPLDHGAVSCPSLNVSEEKVFTDKPVQEDKSKVKSSISTVATSNSSSQTQHLSIPNHCYGAKPIIASRTDIFTTSFTHSLDKNQSGQCNKSENNLNRGFSKSTQNLRKPVQGNILKQPLVRSFSDVPPSALSRSNPNYQSTLSLHLQAKMFKNNYVAQLLDYLFIGSVEAAFNEPLLCKLKIDSLLDISGVTAAQLPSSKKLSCPCMCPKETQHFRSRLIIQIANDEKEDIEHYFSEVNRFILGARRNDKRVLVFSYHGSSRSPTFAIQFLMAQENFLLRQAYNLVKNQRPCVDINPGFMTKLESLERTLFPEAIPSISFGNEYLNIADPQAIKCAWVDYADI